MSMKHYVSIQSRSINTGIGYQYWYFIRQEHSESYKIETYNPISLQTYIVDTSSRQFVLELFYNRPGNWNRFFLNTIHIRFTERMKTNSFDLSTRKYVEKFSKWKLFYVSVSIIPAMVWEEIEPGPRKPEIDSLCNDHAARARWHREAVHALLFDHF